MPDDIYITYLLSKFLAIRNYLKSIKVKYINSIYVHALWAQVITDADKISS